MKKVKIISLLLVIALLRVEECKAGRGILGRTWDSITGNSGRVSESDAYSAMALHDAKMHEAEAAAAKKAAEEQKKREAAQASTATATGVVKETGVDTTSTTSGEQRDTPTPGKKGSGDDDVTANGLKGVRDGGAFELDSSVTQSEPVKVSRLKAIANSIRKLSFRSFLSRFGKNEQELGLKPESMSVLRKTLLRIRNRAIQLADKVNEFVENVTKRTPVLANNPYRNVNEFRQDTYSAINPAPVAYYPEADAIMLGEQDDRPAVFTLEEFAAIEEAGGFEGPEGQLNLMKVRLVAGSSEPLPKVVSEKQKWMDKGLTSEDAQRLIDLEAKVTSGASKDEVDSETGEAKKALTVEEDQELKGLYDKVIAVGKERKAAQEKSLIEQGLTPDQAKRYIDLKSNGFDFLTTDDREFIESLNLGDSESVA